MKEEIIKGFMQSNRMLYQVLAAGANVVRNSSPPSNRAPQQAIVTTDPSSDDDESVVLADGSRFPGDGYNLPTVKSARDVWD